MIQANQYDTALAQGAKVMQSEIAWDYLATAANVTLSAAPAILGGNSLANVTSGSPTVTLPTAVGITGYSFTVKNSGSGTVTLATTSAQTIDGSTTKSLAQYDSITVVSNGANWLII